MVHQSMLLIIVSHNYISLCTNPWYLFSNIMIAWHYAPIHVTYHQRIRLHDIHVTYYCKIWLHDMVHLSMLLIIASHNCMTWWTNPCYVSLKVMITWWCIKPWYLPLKVMVTWHSAHSMLPSIKSHDYLTWCTMQFILYVTWCTNPTSLIIESRNYVYNTWLI